MQVPSLWNQTRDWLFAHEQSMQDTWYLSGFMERKKHRTERCNVSKFFCLIIAYPTHSVLLICFWFTKQMKFYYRFGGGTTELVTIPLLLSNLDKRQSGDSCNCRKKFPRTVARTNHKRNRIEFGEKFHSTAVGPQLAITVPVPHCHVLRVVMLRTTQDQDSR